MTISATEYDFPGLDGLRPGTQTVKVENRGQLEHNWGLFEPEPGKTGQDLVAYFGAGAPPGSAPFRGIPGLVANLRRGEEAMRTLELKPGTYVLFCFVVDPDGRDHFEKGMVKEFTVR